MNIPLTQKEQVKNCFSLLVKQFIKNPAINLVFQEQEQPGLTTTISEELKSYQVSFWEKEFSSVDFLIEVVAHEFTHVFFLDKEGDHDHDKRFFAYVEFFESWLKNRQE